MAPESDSKASPLAVLLDGNSQRVFWGQLISQACDKLMSVGMIWVLSNSFSPKWVPWFIALGALPHFILAAQSGHWISRWGALRTVILSDAFRGVLFLICAWLVYRQGTRYDFQMLLLLMITALISNVAGALFNPAILSLPVDMMDAGEKRDKLTALIDSCFSLGNVLGPLSSALTYAWVGLAGMLAINGLSYFFSALLALGIKLKQAQAGRVIEAKANAGRGADAENNTENNSEAECLSDDASEPPALRADNSIPVAKPILEVLKLQPVIAGMLATFLVMNFFLAPLMIFMPWYAKNVFSDGIMGLAKLEAFLGAGTVAGGLLLSFIRLPGATWLRITICFFIMALSYLSFTFSTNLWHGCISVLLVGFFLALANVITLTFFQSAPEVQDVPVVMGLVNLISVASLPISMGVIGSFVEVVPVRQFATICAVVVMVLAASIRLIPGIEKV